MVLVAKEWVIKSVFDGACCRWAKKILIEENCALIVFP